MSGTNRLGPLVTVGNIRDACLTLAGRDTIPAIGSGFLLDYLADAARQEGKDPDWVARPRSWQMAAEVRKWPSQNLPAVFVAVPGTTGTPRKVGPNLWATYTVMWAACLAGLDDADVDAQSSIYEAAMRAMFSEHGQYLPGLEVESVKWLGSAEDELPQAAGHTLTFVRTHTATFEVELRNVGTVQRGITEPSDTPLGSPGAYPTADTVTVDLEKITD